MEENKSKSFWPGNMKFANERGHFSGCAVKTFRGDANTAPDEELNKWANANPGLLVVELNTNNDDTITVIYTKTMSPEEIEEYDDLARSWAELSEKRKAAKEEAAAAQEKAQRDAEKEVRRLVEVGKTCEHHHASLVEENRKLKKGKGK